MNALTTSASCPQSRQPELKHATVRMAKADLPWGLLAMGWSADESQAFQLRASLQALMPRFDFASCVPFGRDRPGVMFRAAAKEAPPVDLLKAIEALLGLASAQVLHCGDPRRGESRSLRLSQADGATYVEALLLAGDTRAEAWIVPLLREQLPAQAYGRMLLLPGAVPPVAPVRRGRQVCNCMDVGQAEIQATLDGLEGDAAFLLAGLQSRLACGTQCGSCMPEVLRLVKARAELAPASR